MCKRGGGGSGAPPRGRTGLTGFVQSEDEVKLSGLQLHAASVRGTAGPSSSTVTYLPLSRWGILGNVVPPLTTSWSCGVFFLMLHVGERATSSFLAFYGPKNKSKEEYQMNDVMFFCSQLIDPSTNHCSIRRGATRRSFFFTSKSAKEC